MYKRQVNDYDNGGLISKFFTDRPFAKFDAAFLKNFIFTADFDYYHYRDEANTIDNEFAFLDTNLSYQQKDSKWEYSLGVTNLLNNEELNQDNFNDLFFRSSSYIVQPRYVVFKVKYEL